MIIVLNHYLVGGSRPAGLNFVGRTSYSAVGTSGTVAVDLTNLTDGIDTAPIEGDLILVSWTVGTIGANLTPTTPSGYSLIADLWSDDTYETNLAVWYKIATSSDLTSVTVDLPGSARALQVHVRVYSGVNETTPLDVTSTTATGINGGRPDPPAITPTTAGAVIVVIGAGANADMVAFTNSGADLSNFISDSSPTTTDATIGSGHKLDWTSGAFNPSAWLGGSTATGASWAAMTVALRPA